MLSNRTNLPPPVSPRNPGKEEVDHWSWAVVKPEGPRTPSFGKPATVSFEEENDKVKTTVQQENDHPQVRKTTLQRGQEAEEGPRHRCWEQPQQQDAATKADAQKAPVAPAVDQPGVRKTTVQQGQETEEAPRRRCWEQQMQQSAATKADAQKAPVTPARDQPPLYRELWCNGPLSALVDNQAEDLRRLLQKA